MKRTTAELSSIGLFAPFVIAQRMSRMMLPEPLKTSRDHAEDTRMVAEKTKAALDGIAAANIELSRQMMNAWIGMAFGKMPKPAKAADAIASAALKPAKRRVKANVKRLGK